MGTKASTWVRVSPKAEARDTRARRLYLLKANISPKVLYIMPTRAVLSSKVKGNQRATEHIRPLGQVSQLQQHIHQSLQPTRAVKAHLHRLPRPHHQYAATFVIDRTLQKQLQAIPSAAELSIISGEVIASTKSTAHI